MVDRTGSNNSFPTCSEIRDIQRIQTSGEPVISAITSKYQVPDFSVIPQYDITT